MSYIKKYNQVLPEHVVIMATSKSSTKYVELYEYQQKLPEYLTIYGSVYIFDDNNINPELPEYLTIYGSLDVSYSGIEVLPDTINISKSLNISGTKITELPEGLVIGEDLTISQPIKNEHGILVMNNVYIMSDKSSSTFLHENIKVLGKIIY